MKYIPLINSNKKVIIDDDQFDLINQYSWRLLTSAPGYFYAVRYVGNKPVLMHRVLTSAPKNMVVDHINNNGLDNTLSNLRVCTHAENMRHRKLNADNTSGYKGVHKEGNVWRAQLKKNGKNVLNKSFKDIYEAADAYKLAAKKYHKEFATF